MYSAHLLLKWKMHSKYTACYKFRLLLLLWSLQLSTLNVTGQEDNSELANSCPSLPPIFQVFCGNPADEFDCILNTWMCDGKVDCKVTGLDESRATCLNEGPCINHQCKNEAECTPHPAIINHSVAYYTCNCPKGLSGYLCDEGEKENPIIPPTTLPTNVDPIVCVPNPCLNGVCTPLFNNTFHCSCRPYYQGRLCERGLDECTPTPCVNGGICVSEGAGKYRCVCQRGYTGRQCMQDVDECASAPCQNGGTCQDHVGSFSCQCKAGFTGVQCQININECASDPCYPAPGVLCIDEVNRFRCQCTKDRAGQYCERKQLCAVDPCLNYGVCQLLSTGAPRCSCQPGFEGDLCQINVDDCLRATCGTHGRCIDGINSYTCECNPGWTGTACTQELDPCAAQPCRNGGYCCRSGKSWCGIMQPGQFLCYCTDGYTGELCERAREPCRPDPCRNGGLCNELSSSTGYVCTCPLTHGGDRCQVGTPCNSAPCLNNGVCSLTDDERVYKCDCPAAFSGRFCQQVSPCYASPCKNNAKCLLVNDAAYCDCPTGFSGAFCEFPDACVANPCLNSGNCTTEGVEGFICQCPNEYSGEKCEIFKACDPNPCLNGGQCLKWDTVTDYRCECPVGFGGQNCEVVQPCANAPCLNNGVCIPADGEYECQCPQRFTGKNCDILLPCANNPCVNGNCINVGTANFQCQCPTGYGGTLCENQVVGCETSPCKNNGVCSTTATGFNCECTDAFTGPTCEKFRECSLNPCENGGQCVDVDTTQEGYQCTCVPGYTGLKCEILTLCDPNPCLHHGNCSIAGNVVQCSCAGPWKGPRCESYDACLESPCLNGGLCIFLTNSYRCLCTPAFGGDNCETYKHCSSGPCLNHATCLEVNDAPGYECNCTQMFAGLNCQIPVPCGSLPCKNFGQCSNVGTTDYKCTCLENYAGRNCTEKLPCINTPCFRGRCENIAQAPGYRCICDDHFAGTNCDIPLICDEITCLNGECRPRPSDGQMQCLCFPGFQGTNCSMELEPCTTRPCLHNGTCQSTNGTAFTCTCPPTHAGIYCERPALACLSNPCLNGGTCSELEADGGGFLCTCQPPFYGARCELEVTSCVPNPCDQGGDCRSDSMGVFCDCPQPYEGLFCQWIKGLCDPNPCSNNGECWQPTSGIPLCDCPKGYQGALCEEAVGGCSPNPCNGGDCVEGSQGQFQCSCPPEWLGSQCQIRNPCSSNPCQGGGTCGASESGYTCNCPANRSGVNCENALAACSIQPCENGGECEDEGNTDTFICTCKPGYNGDRCENNIDECAGNTQCQNGGKCMDQVNSFSCDCPTGFSGTLCTSRDTCFDRPCSLGAECIPAPNPTYGTDYTCTCPIGFTGASCQLFDYCATVVCLNGGQCVNERDNARCECSAVFTGDRCQTEIVGCKDQACSGNGLCEPQGVFGFTCVCNAGYMGTLCEQDQCKDQPCSNQATCQIGNSTDYQCLCAQGWIGRHCDVAVSPNTSPHFSSSSYLQLQAQSSDNTQTSIQLTIIASGEEGSEGEGLLVLLGPDDPGLGGDFLALGLEAGQLKVTADLGSGPSSITGPAIPLNAWCTVALMRQARSITLAVHEDVMDSAGTGVVVTGILEGGSTSLGVGSAVWIGGAPTEMIKTTGFTKGFSGCVHKVQTGTSSALELPLSGIASSVNIEECPADVNHCREQPCQSAGLCTPTTTDAVHCLCPVGFEGEKCQAAVPVPAVLQLSSPGYIILQNLFPPTADTTKFSLRIRPTDQRDSILLLNIGGPVDHIGLFLIANYLYLRYDLGSGPASIQAPSRISLDTWHSVRVRLSGPAAGLLVETDGGSGDQREQTGSAPGSSQGLTASPQTYVGGLSTRVAVPGGLTLRNGFAGCIENISVSGALIDLSAVRDGYGVSHCRLPPCEQHQCAGGATCIEDNIQPTGYRCLCPAGRAGELCTQSACEALDPPCQNNAQCVITEDAQPKCVCTVNYTGALCTQALVFSQASFQDIGYLVYPRELLFSGVYVGIEIIFRTRSRDGVLLWYGKVDGEYLALGVRNRRAELRVGVASGSQLLTSTLTDGDVDSGNWFQLNAILSGTSLSLQITTHLGYVNRYSTSLRTPFTGFSSNTESQFYLGGLPASSSASGLYSSGVVACVAQLSRGEQTPGAAGGVVWSFIRLQADAVGGQGVSQCAASEENG